VDGFHILPVDKINSENSADGQNPGPDLPPSPLDASKAVEAKPGGGKEVSRSQFNAREVSAALENLRTKCAENLAHRPDIAVDMLLRTGKLPNGVSPGQKSFTLSKDDITPEQIAALPDGYVSNSGLAVDVIAPHFGYLSGKDMVDHLIELEKGRRESGLSADDYFKKLVDSEVTRQIDRKPWRA
jgi:hypothetical protein